MIQKKEFEDKNIDGVDDRIEEQEKKRIVIEAGREYEKELSKKAKHTTTPKSPKAEKNSRKEYNKSSRGQ